MTAASAVASGALNFAMTGASADALTPLTVGIGGFTFAYLPLLVAKAGKLLEAEGLDVTLVDTHGGTNALAATISGSVDLCGLVMSDIILAAAKGQRVQAFAPLMSQYASDAVISAAAAKKIGFAADAPLKQRIAKLKGLTLAISGRGSGTDKLWRYLLPLGGLDPDSDVTLTVVKLDQMYAALKSGQIDGFNTTAPANNRAVADGLAVWAAKPSQAEIPGLENFLYTVLGAKPDYLTRNSQLVAKLVKGVAKGAALIHADPDKAGVLLQDQFFSGTAVELVRSAVSDQKAAVSSPPVLTEAQFTQNRDFMQRFGDDVSHVGFADVVDAQWLAGG